MQLKKIILRGKRENMKRAIIYSLIIRTICFFVLGLSFYLIPYKEGIVNGSTVLWNKRFNEVAYPATHNGHSHQDSAVQNQSLTIKEQLERGIRATKLHVYYHQDKQGAYVPFVCHGVGKDMIDGSYMQKIIDKIPRLFRSWAQDVLKQMEPINEIVRDACCVAYGNETKEGVIPFKHCILDPSRRPLNTMLGEIKTFLDKSPNEVLTVILEDHTKNLDALAQDFKKSGLDSYVHVQDKDKEWPKLSEMVKTGHRLVVLLHGDEHLPYKKYPWMHYMWDYAWDTEWDFQDSQDLKDEKKDIMPKRGVLAFKGRNQGAKNKLFIVHHFVTQLSGGSKGEAKKVNKKPFLQSRLDRLAKQAGHIPNIIQVDFFEVADNDLFDVVNGLNAKV